MRPLLLGLGVILIWASSSEAACTGNSPTWMSTPDQTSVQSCMSNARAGDTILVSAGSATWNNPNFTKSVKLIGAGSGKTVITGSWTMTSTIGARISGFTFNIGTGKLLLNRCAWFRIDHNTIAHDNDADVGIEIWGSIAVAAEGLIDHNIITDGKVLLYGSTLGPQGAGNIRWSEPLNMGTAYAVYVEDNIFNLTNPSARYRNSIDSSWGGRYVVRFNTFNSGRLEQHSMQADNIRASRLWEFYNNTLNNSYGKNYRPFFIRGGTGLIFHNTTDGQFVVNTIDIDNGRSAQSELLPGLLKFGMCDGTSYIDSNTDGMEGYGCRDQIGRSTDASLWDFGRPAPSQEFAPAYFWKNTRTDTNAEIAVRLNCALHDSFCARQNTMHILMNRDYYTFAPSFNGTEGIGEGTLASRPASCTTGVAYWAKDQGDWNSNNPGPDGQLYKCTATNTWSLYYIPYAYPHPLQTGVGSVAINPPAPPANVSIR
jgi:hypothetical protein